MTDEPATEWAGHPPQPKWWHGLFMLLFLLLFSLGQSVVKAALLQFMWLLIGVGEIFSFQATRRMSEGNIRN
ncbi:MAG: hypothetical protein SGJ17_10670 [Hyphomicrobiales bacterium]|nr:hypothetical protein [Hyphomicrobiales bacterium]